MRTSHRLMLAAAILGSVACGSSVGPNSNVVASELPGTWSQNLDVPGSERVMMLSVNDTTVSGTGSWADEAGPAGNLTVTGYINGAQIVLQIAQDDGIVYHFLATLTSINLLSGSLFTTSDPVGATFGRIQQDPP